MPTPLKASNHDPEYANHAGGGIDILARVIHKKGEKRLCVIEIKDENIKNEPQSDAMLQAISYATFISCLLQSKSGNEWWNIFKNPQNPKSTDKQLPEHLYIDVVTLMPKTKVQEKEILGPIEINELHTTFECHSLYYDEEKLKRSLLETRKNPEFIFSGTYPEILKP